MKRATHLGGAGLAAIMLLVTACSGSSGGSVAAGSTSTPGAGSSSPAGTAAYDSVYNQYIQPLTPPEVSPLPSKIPSGKSVIVVTCALPTCAQQQNPAIAAFKKFGWNVKVLNLAFTPQAWSALWDQIVQLKPNVAFYPAVLPSSLVLPKMIQAEKNGTIMVSLTGIVAPGQQQAGGSSPGHAVAIVVSNNQSLLRGKIVGSAVQHFASGQGNAVFAYDPSVASWNLIAQGMSQEIQSTGGKLTTYKIASNIMSPAAFHSALMNYLRSHPSVKELVLPIDDQMVGVPEALKAAGLSGRVQLFGMATNASSQKYLESGEMTADLLDASPFTFAGVDPAVRAVMGLPTGPAQPITGEQILTKDNAAQVTNVLSWPQDLQSAYYTAWGVS